MLRFARSNHSPSILLASFHIFFPSGSAAFTCKQRPSPLFPSTSLHKKIVPANPFFLSFAGTIIQVLQYHFYSSCYVSAEF